MAPATKRQSKRKQYATDDRGRIRLYVGYWINGKGKCVQRPFFFGADPRQVPSRLARVNELWQAIVSEWSATTNGKPVWNHEALGIAQQLAAGTTQIVVPRGTEAKAVLVDARQSQQMQEFATEPVVYAHRLTELSKRYPTVHFVPDDEAAAAHGLDVLEDCRQHSLAQLGALPDNLLPRSSQTMHEALDAYFVAIEQNNQEPTENGPRLSAWGHVRREHAERLKVHHTDCPLSVLDFEGCQRLFDYWRNRPLANQKGKAKKPLSVHYCKHHIDELKRFFKWTSKSKQFDWRKPEDFDELQTKVRKLTAEKTAIPSERTKTHTLEELTLLYQYGSDLERALLLLGLNCGFRGAEMGTVDERHIHLDGHPNHKYFKKFAGYDVRKGDGFILYSRHKTDGENYGEFLLWPETVKAIRFLLARKHEAGHGDKPLLLVTEQGQPFYRRTAGNKNVAQIFSNKWDDLHKRIKVDYPKHRWLSFGKLRKTGSDYIRQISTGEIASCYEMHQAATSDDLLDLYSNRPYGQLFKVLREMREHLRPMFDAVPKAFT